MLAANLVRLMDENPVAFQPKAILPHCYLKLLEANVQLRCPSTTAFTYAARAFCQ